MAPRPGPAWERAPAFSPLLVVSALPATLARPNDEEHANPKKHETGESEAAGVRKMQIALVVPDAVRPAQAKAKERTEEKHDAESE